MREPSPERIETEHTPAALPRALAAASGCGLVLLVVYAARWPSAALAMVAGLTALAAFGAWSQAVRTRFEFDAGRRRIRWLRGGPGRTLTGVLRFEDVRQVVLQMGPGRHARRARICLVTASGLEPLARDFSVDATRAQAMAARLRTLIGVSDADAVQEHAKALIRDGDESGAVAWLAERQGLTRDQARELVRHLKDR